MNRLRALVADGLLAMSKRAEQTLAPALARARQAWDKVDSHVILEPALVATLSVTRRTLQQTADGDGGALGAVAVEGLIALEAAEGLCALAERRLSSLIRLRLQDTEELLPADRPFLDLGAALAEAARTWTLAWA